MRRLILIFTLFSAMALRADVIVSTEWLQSHLRDRGLVVVEIGDRAAFEKGHIPGARFVALRDIAVTRDGIENELPDLATIEKVMSAAGVPERGQIVVYGRDVIHAARGFFTLDYAGCGATLSFLDGGFPKWSAEQRAVESGPPAPRTACFVACPRPELLVNIGAVRKLVDHPSLVLVDARPAEAFDKGHIGRAVSIPWTANLTTGAIPVFRGTEELRALYGVDRGPAVVYCRTGMQASVDYLALRALGREAYLYDGSWSEWSAAKP